MTNFNNPRIGHTLTTDFKLSLLPLYDGSGIETSTNGAANNPQLSSITQTAINIYAPYQRVTNYDHLICEEVVLRHSLYNRHQPVASIWWQGSPLQQFSPEAITELCFRLSSHFSHQQESTIRGLTVEPMELDEDNLALLKGLKFNAVKLNIDACVASSNRSLSKIEMALQMLADCKSFELSCVIKLSNQTAPEFLQRLLNLLESSHCTRIEVTNHKIGPISLQGKMVCQNQLASIHAHFEGYDWLACGNNNFFAPSHPVRKTQDTLVATPWGYQTKHIPSWLGFGVASISFNNGNFEYNTPSIQRYMALLAEKKSPVENNFYLHNNKTTNFKIIQDLLCRHATVLSDLRLHNQLASLIPSEWLKENKNSLVLSKTGVLNLSSICEKLFEPIFA